MPMAPAVNRARASTARCSAASPAPSACAVSATVPMRRKPNSQNMQSKISDAMATPPSTAASPSWPMAAVATMPSSGVVTLATIAGPANAKTLVELMSTEAVTSPPRSLSPGGVGDAQDQPDRDDDDGAEQEITPQPAHRVEAHIPDVADQPLGVIVRLI